MPIAARNGYRPCFTLGDVLALKIVKAITEEFGVPVGQLSQLAPDLYEVSGQTHLDFRRYDFAHIPIETLSVVYEQFLHAEDRGKNKGRITHRFMS